MFTDNLFHLKIPLPEKAFPGSEKAFFISDTDDY